MMKAFLCLILFISLISNLSANVKHKFMEKSKLNVRHDVIKVKTAAADSRHKLIFAVKQKNLERLNEVLYEVSDPISPNYGQHLSREEVAALTANLEGSSALRSYLEANNIKIISETLYGEYLTAESTVAQWEEMLSCRFDVYKLLAPEGEEVSTDEDTKHHVIRTESYSVPEELSTHLFAVFNTVQFPHRLPRNKMKRSLEEMATLKANNFKQKASTNGNLRSKAQSSEPAINWNSPGLTEGAVTPEFILLNYDVPFSAVDSTVTQGVLESLNDGMSPSDLSAFQQAFNLEEQPIASDSGGHVSNNACDSAASGFSDCGESNLDIQYLMGVAQGAPTSYIYVDEELNGNLDWVNFFTTVVNTPHPLQVYSISYGTYEFTLDRSTMAAFDTEAMKLGVMGTTIVASSGDDGVIGFYARGNASFCGYFAQYPASSPYVLAVGGTNGPQFNDREIACMSQPNGGPSISSGGGFSSVYPMPAYQKTAVAGYFALVDGTPFQPVFDTHEWGFSGTPVQPSFFNRSGRGYPDVSLVAHNYLVYTGGQQVGVDGTSASAPVMAALITLTNYQRLLQGNKTMGWVNPFLYRYAADFTNDVTFGMNNCTATFQPHGTNNFAHTCCKQGFHATAGWDPITGLGSINFKKFLIAAGIDVADFPTLAPTKAPSIFDPSTSGLVNTLGTGTFFQSVASAVEAILGMMLVCSIIYLLYTRCWKSRGKKSKKTAKVMHAVVPEY